VYPNKIYKTLENSEVSAGTSMTGGDVTSPQIKNYLVPVKSN